MFFIKVKIIQNHLINAIISIKIFKRLTALPAKFFLYLLT